MDDAKNAKTYFNLFSKAEVQLPDYPRGTACYARAQHVARLLKWHGRDVELIWALGTINNFVPTIKDADWGNGMAFHVAVRDKETNLVYDQAFFHEPLPQEQWVNTFTPIRPDGVRPRIETSDTETFARMVGNEPKLLTCTTDAALEIAKRLYESTVRKYSPTPINKLGAEAHPDTTPL